ncbi:hypothetical protein GKZ90_0023975 [Flavobacterium sp. MC2016-06]|uniref:hypothetical protein n=1 Tax=Flavobacterium sp. MC2016-06 TaxID=2676308 RepID=UPI0012BB0DD5|nr:hypothetical protein [Flavobacterium sp. MC2016-06]MBU3860701.1 hypothetical protein [Flavobacterium sp. MC2016-06]
MNKKDTRFNVPYVTLDEARRIQTENKEPNQKIDKKDSNDILYTSYQDLDSLPYLVRENYGIIKLMKDSFISVNPETKVKILKDYYFQNNHDDSLRMAFKSPKNLNIFIYEFETKEDVEKSFRILKRKSNLERCQLDNSTAEKIFFSYEISKKDKRFNGYTLSFKNDKNIQTFFEFESDKLSKKELKKSALDFLLHNVIKNKL